MHIYSKNMFIKFSEMQRENIDTYLWSIFPMYTSFFSQVILKISREVFRCTFCLFMFCFCSFLCLFMQGKHSKITWKPILALKKC